MNIGRDMSVEIAAVSRHYDDVIFDYEAARLDTHSPVEFAMTSRYLRRHVSAGAIVADVGVGVGHYAELLAQHGCDIHLVDISTNLLHTAQMRLSAAGFADRIAGTHIASATDLRSLASGSIDVALMLGPLYHLRDLAARRQAVHEAARVLRPGGLVFAAAINRLAFLRAAFDANPECVVERKARYEQFIRDGVLDPASCPPLGYAHLSTVAELRLLFRGFEEIALVGLESFTAPWLAKLGTLPAAVREAWLDVVEQTAAMPEALGHSDHFLFIGRA